MRVKFRGVRGSVPWSVPEGIIHGCNTPCIEIFDERNNGILILDAGSGIVGVSPASLCKTPCPVSLVLTHYHWDHLLGLPFFAALYQRGWDLTINTPTLASHDPSWLRIKGPQGDLVYATDHEFGNPKFDEPLAAFASGAAAMVLDAHFTPDELPNHKGWGHSDWRQCAEFASANGIGKLYLFHHKPGRSDQALADIRVEAQKVFATTDTASEETFIDI